MYAIADRIVTLHRTVFGAVERALEGWFLGLAARFVFAAVLWLYFLNSARTKEGGSSRNRPSATLRPVST
jgi:putative oxidoreductase